jgi:hypothetical protein
MVRALNESDPVALCLLVLGGVVLAVIGLLAEYAGRRRAVRLAPAVLLWLGLLLVPFLNSRAAAVTRPALGLLAGASVLFYVLRTPRAAWVARRLWNAARDPRAQWATLLAVCLALLPVASHRLDPVPADLSDFAASHLVDVDPAQFQPVVSHRAYTDRGRAITLYAAPPTDRTYEDHLTAEAAVLRQLQDPWPVLRLAPPDRAANCHGWTFGSGQFWIQGRDIDPILADNGYQAVSAPQAHDVAIFRDADNQVLHSGVVRGLTRDGHVLIESKWGWSGRYLHPASCSAYGTRVTFYRTDRGGNLLRIQPEAAESKPNKIT